MHRTGSCDYATRIVGDLLSGGERHVTTYYGIGALCILPKFTAKPFSAASMIDPERIPKEGDHVVL